LKVLLGAPAFVFLTNGFLVPFASDAPVLTKGFLSLFAHDLLKGLLEGQPLLFITNGFLGPFAHGLLKGLEFPPFLLNGFLSPLLFPPQKLFTTFIQGFCAGFAHTF